MTETSTNDDSLRRWRRWCVFGWVLACVMTVTAVAGTGILARALRTEAALTREAQTMAAQYLTDLAEAKLRLNVAEQRLTELDEAVPAQSYEREGRTVTVWGGGRIPARRD